MKFNKYTNIHAFHDDVHGVLLRDETQNLIPLGNIIIGVEGKDKTGWRDPVNWFMATVTDTEGIRLTAVMTPPRNLTLYATDNEIYPDALDALIDGILAEKIKIPGVATEKTLAFEFAEKYALAKGVSHKIAINMRVHELRDVSIGEVSDTNLTNFEKIRLLEERDLAFYPYWTEYMQLDFFGIAPKQICCEIESYRHFLNDRSVYILEAGGIPVTTARITRRMKTVAGIAAVYTPPYFRRNGYATACVAQLSRLVLDMGFSRVALYTDLANPTSNSIYKKIGYEPVCDSLDIKFE